MPTINNRFENLTLERLQEIYDLVLAVPTSTTWGSITGTLALQTDLQTALNGKFNNPTGTISQYIRGDGTLANFPSLGLTVGSTTIATGVVGRVLFQGTGNVLQQSGNLFWDNTNSRLGIGTSSPTYRLEVQGGDVRFANALTIGDPSVSVGWTFSSNTLTVLQNGFIGVDIASGRSFNITDKFTFSTTYFAVAGTTGNILINTSTDAGYKLDVIGSVKFGTNFTWNNASNFLTITGLLTCTSQIRAGQYLIGGTLFGGSTSNLFWLTGGTATAASGVLNAYFNEYSYSPTSGTQQMNVFNASPVINQTGGASGITRGLYINPTLTAAADFRAIETTAGNVLFGASGTGFYWDNTNSRLGVGIATPLAKIETNGTFRTTGSTVPSTGVGLELSFASGTGNIYSFNRGTTAYSPLNLNDAIRIFSTLNVGVGTITDAGFKLDVNGTARTGNLSTDRIQNASNNTWIEVIGSTGIGSNDASIYLGARTGNTYTNTSGFRQGANMIYSFAPTSGTAIFTGFQITPTINQTGGANGITRGLYINPTLTAAADFRAIETTAGNVLFGASGTGFYWDNTNARLGIGTSSPTTTVDIVKSYAGALDNLIPQLRFQNSSVAASADLYALARVLVGTGYVGSYPEIWVQAYRSAANVGTASIRVVSNHPLTFLTSDSERARIFANGNFAIGTTTDAGYKLDVNGSTRIGGVASGSAALHLKGQSGFGQYLYFDNGTGNGLWTMVGSTVFAFDSATTRVLRISPSAQVTINGNTNIGSAQLQVDSTTRGFLPPRMTTAEKTGITSLVAGLIVYDATLNKLCVYTGTVWETITSA